MRRWVPKSRRRLGSGMVGLLLSAVGFLDQQLDWIGKILDILEVAELVREAGAMIGAENALTGFFLAMMVVSVGVATSEWWLPPVQARLLRRATPDEKRAFRLLERKMRDCLDALDDYENPPRGLVGQVARLKSVLELRQNMLIEGLDPLRVWWPEIYEGFDPRIWRRYLMRLSHLAHNEDLDEARKRGGKLGWPLPGNDRLEVLQEGWTFDCV